MERLTQLAYATAITSLTLAVSAALLAAAWLLATYALSGPDGLPLPTW